MARPRIDLTGQRFGRLFVEHHAYQTKWWVVCDCGNQKQVEGALLRNGNTRSCGCLRDEVAREQAYARQRSLRALRKQEQQQASLNDAIAWARK